MVYSSEALTGEGTLLDLCQVGCRAEGTMQVNVGMLLTLSISPPHKEDQLCVQKARVLWVKDDHFGLELQGLAPADERWLQRYLENAERRNSYRVVDQTSAVENLATKPLTLPLKD
jgi:PilZ domain